MASENRIALLSDVIRPPVACSVPGIRPRTGGRAFLMRFVLISERPRSC